MGDRPGRVRAVQGAGSTRRPLPAHRDRLTGRPRPALLDLDGRDDRPHRRVRRSRQSRQLRNDTVRHPGWLPPRPLGLGTTSPQDYFHVSFDDPFGAFTGLAVQNRNGGANASSGMLFFDQNGALAQFQGFSNASHEYRINNLRPVDRSISRGRQLEVPRRETGNIGIGARRRPPTKLRVAGNTMVDGNLAAKDQDVAEWVEAASPLEAGTAAIVDRRSRIVSTVGEGVRDARRGRRLAPAGYRAGRAQRQPRHGGAKRPRPHQGGCALRHDQDRRSGGDEPDRGIATPSRPTRVGAGRRIVRARCSERRSRRCDAAGAGPRPADVAVIDAARALRGPRRPEPSCPQLRRRRR